MSLTTYVNNASTDLTTFADISLDNTLPPLSDLKFSSSLETGKFLVNTQGSLVSLANLRFYFWRGITPPPTQDQAADGAILTDINNNLLDKAGNFTFTVPSKGTIVITDPSTGGGNGNGDNNRTRNIIIFIVIFIIIIIIIIIIIVIAKGGKKSDSDDLSALEGLQLEQ